MDAADEFSNIVDTYDAMRADLAELRHEMRRELDVVKTRLDQCATKADLAELRTELQAMRADMHQSLTRQSHWVLGVLVTILVAVFLKN